MFSVITERRIGVSNNFTGPKGFEEVCHVIEVYNGSDFPQIDCRFSGNIRNDNANFHHHRRLDASGEGHAYSVQQNYHQQGSQQDKVIGLPVYWKAELR